MLFLYDNLDQVKAIADKISPALEARMAANGLALVGYLYDGASALIVFPSVTTIVPRLFLH